MRILHVIPSFPPAWRYGGPVRAGYEMGRALARRGAEVSVYTTDIDGAGNLDVPLGAPTHQEGMKVTYFSARSPRSYTYSPKLARALRRDAGDFDLVHVHSVLNWPSTAAARAARKARRPYIVRPCGILERIAFTHAYGPSLRSLLSRARKASYFRAVERRNLRHAAAIHYTTEAERQGSSWARLETRNFVIPLGVEPPARPPGRADARERAAEAWDLPEDATWILFLSRVDPVKGLPLLLEAASRLDPRRSPHVVLVAGSGSTAYVGAMRTAADSLGLGKRVRFLGSVTGADKDTLLAASDVFALPSYQESFGVAVVEAMAAGLPVLVSEFVGVQGAVVAAGAGRVAPLDARAIEEHLRWFLGRPTERRQMGQRAKALAATRYNWDSIARDLIHEYESILDGNGGRPR